MPRTKKAPAAVETAAPEAAQAPEQTQDTQNVTPATEAHNAKARLKLNLWQRLLAVESQIGKIEKTGKNEKLGYGFIEQSQIAARIRTLFVSYGVKVVVDEVSNELIGKEKWDNTAKQIVPAGAKSRKHVRYMFINVDDPNEHTEWLNHFSEADDTVDKASNKASTANQKYFYIRQFNISDQDPDELQPEEGAPANPKSKISTQQSTDIYTMLIKLGADAKEFEEKKLSGRKIDDLTNQEAAAIIASLTTIIMRKQATKQQQPTPTPELSQ